MPGQAAGPTITGALVRAHLDILRLELGSAVVAQALADLPAEARLEIEGVTAASWVPIPAYEAFYAAVAHRGGRDVAELHSAVSRQSVEQAFRTMWRILLRLTSDEALVTRTPLMFTRAYTHGKLTSGISAPGQAHVELSAWPAVPDIVMRGVRVAVETVLHLAGRKNARVVAQRSADGATFRATWGSSGAPAPISQAPSGRG
jgi:hypothetical protein